MQAFALTLEGLITRVDSILPRLRQRPDYGFQCAAHAAIPIVRRDRHRPLSAVHANNAKPETELS